MNEENLKPAKPGEVRNPGGRPKGSKNRSTVARKILGLLAKDAITAASLGVLRSIVGDKIDTMTVEEVMTLVQVNDAVSGKRRGTAYKIVLDSAYGYPKQPVEHTGEDGGPILIDDVSQMSTDQLKNRLDELKKKKKEQPKK